jgi:hypothetical protein
MGTDALRSARCRARAWRAADRLSCLGRPARQRRSVLGRRDACFADRCKHRQQTEHDLDPVGRGDQISRCSAIPKRLLDIERVRVRVCRQHLRDNGGDNADIMGAVSRQGVTVLDGKRHGGEDNTDLGDAPVAMHHLQMVRAIAMTRCRGAAAELHRAIVEPAEPPLAARGVELED